MNYTPANPPMQPNPSARPQGKYSVPVADINKPWRVRVDYGTVTGGLFTPWGGVNPIDISLNNISPNGNGDWQQPGAVSLVDPPQDLRARARLQNFISGNWVDKDDALADCP